MLAYGAICGFALVFYVTGNLWLGLVLGISPGIIGIGVPVLLHKHFGSSPIQFSFLPAAKQRQILIIAGVSITGWLGYRAFIGDWFGFVCTAMAAGTLTLFFAHALGYWRQPPIDRESLDPTPTNNAVNRSGEVKRF